MTYGQKLSHAYLITGESEAAGAEARRLAAAMLCSAPERRPCGLCRDCGKSLRGIHPDIITVMRPTDDKGKIRREIYVDQIREISQSAHILPNEARRKVYIVTDAGTMNPSAQNALLKLLEEPPDFVSFILVADSAAQLLETVRSRCVTINLKAADTEPTAESRLLAEKYLAAAAKKNAVGLLSFCNVSSELSAGDTADFVRAVRILLTDMLAGRLPELGLPRGELMRLVKLMERAQEYLRFNVSVKHIFGMLSVDTIEQK